MNTAREFLTQRITEAITESGGTLSDDVIERIDTLAGVVAGQPDPSAPPDMWANTVTLQFVEETGMIQGTWPYAEDEDIARIVADDAHIVAALLTAAPPLLALAVKVAEQCYCPIHNTDPLVDGRVCPDCDTCPDCLSRHAQRLIAQATCQ